MSDPPAHLDLLAAVTDADLAELTRALADAVVIADAEGTITFWNDAATRLFGWPAPEAVGAPLDLIIPERQRERHWAGYQRVMATGHTDDGDRLLEVPAFGGLMTWRPRRPAGRERRVPACAPGAPSSR